MVTIWWSQPLLFDAYLNMFRYMGMYKIPFSKIGSHCILFSDRLTIFHGVAESDTAERLN